jgi:hypothetical protein
VKIINDTVDDILSFPSQYGFSQVVSTANKKSELSSTWKSKHLMMGERSKQTKKEQWHTQLWLQKIVLSACLIEHNYKEK